LQQCINVLKETLNVQNQTIQSQDQQIKKLTEIAGNASLENLSNDDCIKEKLNTLQKQKIQAEENSELYQKKYQELNDHFIDVNQKLQLLNLEKNSIRALKSEIEDLHEKILKKEEIITKNQKKFTKVNKKLEILTQEKKKLDEKTFELEAEKKKLLEKWQK
jgi:chromosome segregation ATPase